MRSFCEWQSEQFDRDGTDHDVALLLTMCSEVIDVRTRILILTSIISMTKTMVEETYSLNICSIVN